MTTMKTALSMVEENRILRWCSTHQRTFFSILTITILLIPLIANALLGKPLLVGEETYYHLSEHLSETNDKPSHLLQVAVNLLPRNLLPAVPLLLGLITVLLLLALGSPGCSITFRDSTSSTNSSSNQGLLFFFLLFWILSPAFIFSFSTLSGYAVVLTMMLCSILAFRQSSWYWNITGIVLLISAFGVDLMSSLLGIVVVFVASYKAADKNSHSQRLLPWIVLAVGVITLSLLHFFVHPLPPLTGPFHEEEPWRDLISTFGGLSGVSLFTILLAVLGLRSLITLPLGIMMGLLLALFSILYPLRTETIVFLSLPIAYFGAAGFLRLFQNRWKLFTLRNFTLLLTLLGILFSTLSYYTRMADFSPTAGETQALAWIRENTPPDALVFSSPEQGYYLRTIAAREPFYMLHEPYGEQKRQFTERIFSALYIDGLTPLLEQQRITVLYLPARLRHRLPQEQGLLFLLKNERFKLAYTSGGSEVWAFNKYAAVQKAPPG